VFATPGLQHVTQAMNGDGGDALDSAAALIDFLCQGYVLVSALTLLPALAVA
jgi:hypothetical protein